MGVARTKVVGLTPSGTAKTTGPRSQSPAPTISSSSEKRSSGSAADPSGASSVPSSSSRANSRLMLVRLVVLWRLSVTQNFTSALAHSVP